MRSRKIQRSGKIPNRRRSGKPSKSKYSPIRGLLIRRSRKKKLTRAKRNDLFSKHRRARRSHSNDIDLPQYQSSSDPLSGVPSNAEPPFLRPKDIQMVQSNEPIAPLPV